MRAFIALPLPETVLDTLTRVQSLIPVGRPVAEDNLHLTLAFLGEIGDGQAMDLHLMLQGLRAAPVEITFEGLDTFTEMERGLVFAAVAPEPALSDLQSRVARIVRQAGLDLPRRRFRPHVTLTRANRRPDGPARDRLAAILGRTHLSGVTVTVDQVCLYASTLGPRGARHDVLGAYPLSTVTSLP